MKKLLNKKDFTLLLNVSSFKLFEKNLVQKSNICLL